VFKNVAASFMVFAFDTTNNTAKTGDAANITAYVSKDYGAVTVLGDTSATEMDATNAPGYYLFAAAQAETNADVLMVSAKSSTANIAVIGAPAVIYTRPTTGWLAPTTAGRTLDVSAGGEAGIDWANIGSPTTAQNLSGTNIDVDQVVASVSGAVASVTTVNGLAANVITAASMAADASAEIADAVWDEDATGHQTTGTFGQAIGDPVADANTIYGAVVTGAAGATVAADIMAVKAETAAIVADTNELQTDWANGGRLDLILDARASQTSVDTIDGIVDAILVDTAEIGAAGAGLTAINLPNQTMDITGNITGNLSGSVGSVTGAVGSVTGAVGSVTGLTASDVGAIKAKTDNLTFTVANQVDANIKSVAGTTVTGTGAAGDEWGP
jgi:hypothetical protein